MSATAVYPEQPLVGSTEIRVLLLSDCDIVRGGLRAILAAEPDLELVGEAATVPDALLRAASERPAIVVVDEELAGRSGPEVRDDLASHGLGVPCLVLTSVANGARSRTDGALPKELPAAELVGAVRKAAYGEPWAVLPPAPRPAAVDHRVGLLTAQERQVLRLLGEGLTNRQIGARLFLTEKTVKNYVSSVLAKLGMVRRTQAAVFAVLQPCAS